MDSVNQRFHFVPRERRFWVLHCSVTALVFLLQIITFATFRPEIFKPNALSSVLWLGLFTLTMLFYRWLYKYYQLYRRTTGYQVVYGLVYSLLGAGVITSLIFAFIAGFFWELTFSPEELEEHGVSLGLAVTAFFINNILLQTFLLCGWIFIYNSYTASRRATQNELQNLKLQNSLKEAQLTSLNNQLNPHFLFNTLNNIRFMIHENPDHADQMVTSLSDVLRYSLTTSGQRTVSIARELDTIRQFVEISHLQMEQRLNLKMDVSARLEQYAIPPMTLQLLVENAIKHGADNREQTSTLQLSATESNGQLSFVVTNPKPDKPQRKAGTGTGLNNIRQRLALLYGDSAQLSVHETATEFTATMVIPAELYGQQHGDRS